MTDVIFVIVKAGDYKSLPASFSETGWPEITGLNYAIFNKDDKQWIKEVHAAKPKDTSDLVFTLSNFILAITYSDLIVFRSEDDAKIAGYWAARGAGLFKISTDGKRPKEYFPEYTGDDPISMAEQYFKVKP